MKAQELIDKVNVFINDRNYTGAENLIAREWFASMFGMTSQQKAYLQYCTVICSFKLNHYSLALQRLNELFLNQTLWVQLNPSAQNYLDLIKGTILLSMSEFSTSFTLLQKVIDSKEKSNLPARAALLMAQTYLNMVTDEAKALAIGLLTNQDTFSSGTSPIIRFQQSQLLAIAENDLTKIDKVVKTLTSIVKNPRTNMGLYLDELAVYIKLAIQYKIEVSKIESLCQVYETGIPSVSDTEQLKHRSLLLNFHVYVKHLNPYFSSSVAQDLIDYAFQGIKSKTPPLESSSLEYEHPPKRAGSPRFN